MNTFKLYSKLKYLVIFRVFKFIYQFYREEQICMTYKLTDKNRINIISLLFKNDKNVFMGFEIMKKLDDIFVMLFEIRNKAFNIKNNCKELFMNIFKLAYLSTFLVVENYFFIFIGKEIIFGRCLFFNHEIFYILINQFSNNFYMNLWSIFRFLRRLDDILIGILRISRCLYDIKKFLFKIDNLRNIRQLSALRIGYCLVIGLVKITRKIFEMVIFTAKIVKIANEIVKCMIRQLEKFDNTIKNKKFI